MPKRVCRTCGKDFDVEKRQRVEPVKWPVVKSPTHSDYAICHVVALQSIYEDKKEWTEKKPKQARRLL